MEVRSKLLVTNETRNQEKEAFNAFCELHLVIERGLNRKTFLQKYKSTLLDHELEEVKESNKLLARTDKTIERAQKSLKIFESQNPKKFAEWSERLNKKLK